VTCDTNEIDFDEFLSNVAVAAIGNILTVTAVTELLRVQVPDLPCPVYIGGQVTFQNNGASGTNGQVTLVIGPASATNVLAAALAVDSHGALAIGGTTTESSGRKLFVARRLAPHSPGDYILGAWRNTGSDAVNALGNSLLPMQVWARRA
jgi:hypothetical protein